MKHGRLSVEISTCIPLCSQQSCAIIMVTMECIVTSAEYRKTDIDNFMFCQSKSNIYIRLLGFCLKHHQILMLINFHLFHLFKFSTIKKSWHLTISHKWKRSETIQQCQCSSKQEACKLYNCSQPIRLLHSNSKYVRKIN